MIGQLDVKEESGATLVELMIAMALLLAVLMPATAFVSYIATYSKNAEKILAISKAQTVLEIMARRKSFDKLDQTVQLEKGWSLKKRVTINNSIVLLEVQVLRHDVVIVTMTTVRLNHNRDYHDTI